MYACTQIHTYNTYIYIYFLKYIFKVTVNGQSAKWVYGANRDPLKLDREREQLHSRIDESLWN